MRLRIYMGILLTSSVSWSTLSRADTPSSSQMDHLSLDDILNLKVTVTSKKAVSLRESPGIVSVLTDSEIRDLGARDLIDVLQMIPGVTFGVDVLGTVDIGVRGNWAHEGKALLIIDDHEMNELNYSTLQFGNHYPVDQIKKIEIIRGPGSVIYGGNAELTVIKVTTKSADDLNGVEASFKLGQTTDSLSRAVTSIQAGKSMDDFKIKIGTFFGSGNRSDRPYTDLYGNQFSMSGNSKNNPLFLNTDIHYKDLSVSFLYDHYSTTYQDGYGLAFPQSIAMNFDSYLGTAKYDFKILENKLKITPILQVDRFSPWNSTDPTATALQHLSDNQGVSIFSNTGVNYSRQTERIRLSLIGSYDLHPNLNLLAGIERNFLSAHDELGTFQGSGTDFQRIDTVALYGQGMWTSSLFNLTVGARYEDNSAVGSAFVPRAALTKTMDDLHFKLIASSAFRAPSFENIESNPLVKPEKTIVYEFETGYQFSKEFFLTANLFDITIHDPIVYSPQVGHNDSYSNFAQTGSRGFEVESKYVGKTFSTTASYSFYSTAGKNTVDAYAVPGRNDVVLGLPTHKLSVVSPIRLSERLTLSPSLIWLGNRFGYDYAGVPTYPYADVANAKQSAQLVNFAPTFLVNTAFSYKDFLIKNLTAGFGGYNLLNEDYRYIQPYYSAEAGHAPLPSSTREFVLSLSYRYAL